MTAAAGTELEVIDSWIVGTLAADAPLAALLYVRVDGVPSVYADMIPPDAQLPAVVFSLSADNDVNVATRGDRIMIRAAYNIKVVDASESWTTTAAIFSLMDQLLTVGAPVSPAYGGTMLGGRRLSNIKYVEPPDLQGRQYRHRGGIYELFAQTTD